jgi:hypothetical protein
VDYLVKEKGINAERITAKGIGKRRLKISDAQIKLVKSTQEKDALHAVNRRTTFKIMSWNYVDPKAPSKPPVVMPKVFGEENNE